MKEQRDIFSMTFKRKCSVNLYKNLKLKLGEMSFTGDFANDTRGDLYPLIEKSGGFFEKIENFSYAVSGEKEFYVERLLGQFFPYANYKIKFDSKGCGCGFVFRSPRENAVCKIIAVKNENGKIGIAINHGEEEYISTDIPFAGENTLIVNSVGNSFYVYLKSGEYPVYVGKTVAEKMEHIKELNVFNCADVSVALQSENGGSADVKKVEFYLDCGICQADMKPIKYEDGMPYIEGGRVFLTMSSRFQEEQYQTVISWLPGTCEFKLEGAIFYDHGNDVWENDVAASVIYNRKEGLWQLWVAGFSSSHRLAHGTSKADLRFGINVVDVKPMDFPEIPDDKAFAAKNGDEDPDFFFDEETGKWYMAICRIVTDEAGTNYRYFMFESDKPFEDYKYVTHSLNGCETGGSFVKVAGKRCFVCGSNFDKRALYHIYPLGDFSAPATVKCDFDDGGFRGWGTIIPVPCGNRTKYEWITFDRHLGSSWNWSYGNIYIYESDMMNNE